MQVRDMRRHQETREAGRQLVAKRGATLASPRLGPLGGACGNRWKFASIGLLLLIQLAYGSFTQTSLENFNYDKAISSSSSTDSTDKQQQSSLSLSNKQALDNNKLVQTKSSAKLEDEASTRSLLEFIDGNYLGASNPTDTHHSKPNQSARQSAPTAMVTSSFEEISSVNLLKLQPNTKNRRQSADSKQLKVSDWWTELIFKNKRQQVSDTKSRTDKRGSANNDNEKPTSVYKEQPLSQNSILTFKNQLVAIRSKHGVLMTRAVPQLQQLDQKLVDSYKLCLKRRMPLYAGMLYRTRDFVVRMANEVKHERQVLEAMARQIQKVLRQRIANRTLVKDYNRFASSHTDLPSSAELQQLVDSNKRPDSLKASINSEQTSLPVRFKDDGSHFVENQLDSITQHDKLNEFDSSAAATTSKTSEKYRPRQSSTKSHPTKLPVDSANIQQQQWKVETDKNDCTTKKPKQTKYTVHVNEVILKSELSKTQALVDRINGSFHELMGVVDDIIYLFKLTTESKRGLSASGKTNKLERSHATNHLSSLDGTTMMEQQQQQQHRQKKIKKMPKPPIRVFLEKQGKLTMSNFDSMYNASALGNSNNDYPTTTRNGTTDSNSEITNMDNLPELKPLFDSSSLAAFTEPPDQELGFDVATPVYME